jgi:hypothetical protein
VRLQRAAGACARRSRRVRYGANERHPSQEIPLIFVLTLKLVAAFQAYPGALTPTALTDRGSGLVSRLRSSLSPCGTHWRELRSRKDTSKIMILVWFWV